MPRLKKSLLLILVCLNIGILGACKGGEEGPAERVGKQVDEAVEKAAEKVEEAKKKVSEEAAETQKKLGEKMEETGKNIKEGAE